MPVFADLLIRWHGRHGRHHLPWQGTRDPYAVWLSEIMLQQTQVATVIPYYLRFLQHFPDMASLARASLDEVLALWSGLGYYTRGRCLHQAAQLIMCEHGGEFPRSAATIRQLPGIGRSTAAAIAVFAFGERCAILDGNVKRVLCRYLGVDGYPGDRQTEALLWQQAEQMLPQEGVSRRIETYTQALMDLGAMICSRARPQCTACPLRRECVAFRQGRVDKLPTPRPRRPLPQKEVALLLLLNREEILLEKRPPTGIWGGLWSLPEMPPEEDAATYCASWFGMQVQPLAQLPPLEHAFTHFRLRIHPRPVQVISQAIAERDGQRWLPLATAGEAAIPTPVRKLLAQCTA